MDSYEENRQTMIAQINEELEVLDNDDLASVIAFLSNLEDYTEEEGESDSDDEDEDEDEENYRQPEVDPNSEEYKQLVSKLSAIALPPLSK